MLIALPINVVVPSYRLVWYNGSQMIIIFIIVVVPSYRLVWYNEYQHDNSSLKLLFPVIAWYGIIFGSVLLQSLSLLFPVIAWYGIIESNVEEFIEELLFPVIAWYGIISQPRCCMDERCCSQLSLGMV